MKQKIGIILFWTLFIVGFGVFVSNAFPPSPPYDTDLTTWAGVTPGENVTTVLATPSSANLANAITDETGSGVLVFGTSPTLTTPSIVRPTPITHAATEASGANLYGHTHLVTGAYTVTLPAVSVGMHGRFYATTAALFSVDCNAADHFVLAGVALTNGNKVSSDASVGAFFEWECTAEHTITIFFSNVNFVDGGA